jgi:hypothetical protein
LVPNAPSEGLFVLEVEWLRSGSTEGAIGAGLNTGLGEKLKATAVPNADAKLHTVGSGSRQALKAVAGNA